MKTARDPRSEMKSRNKVSRKPRPHPLSLAIAKRGDNSGSSRVFFVERKRPEIVHTSSFIFLGSIYLTINLQLNPRITSKEARSNHFFTRYQWHTRLIYLPLHPPIALSAGLLGESAAIIPGSRTPRYVGLQLHLYGFITGSCVKRDRCVPRSIVERNTGNRVSRAQSSPLPSTPSGLLPVQIRFIAAIVP